MITIKQYLQETLQLNTASDETYEHIDEWENWYKGEVPSFHTYNVYNGMTTKAVERYRLNMAKTICEDWAGLILNEKVKIHTDTDFDKVLGKIFESNNFQVKGNQLIELAFAFGTGAFVEYLNGNGEVTIDFIRAGMIYPLSWENGYVNECAFGSMKEDADGSKIYVQLHKLNEKGQYIIENHMVDADGGNELELPDDMEEVIETLSERPMFQLISPNIINNIDLDSPLGISAYGNAISQLKGCDLVYDSYMNEFNMGRRRIMVPLSMAKMQMSDQGTTKPIFDPSDTMFYAYPDDRNGTNKIEPMDMSIRAQEHELGINKALDMLSFKCGMGTGRYKFENGNVKTATEVISADSDLYRTLTKHELVIGSSIKGLVQSIAYLSGTEVDKEKIVIDFDDSIIQDKDAERKQDERDMANGTYRPEEYRAKWRNETKEEALANLPQQAEVIE